MLFWIELTQEDCSFYPSCFRETPKTFFLTAESVLDKVKRINNPNDRRTFEEVFDLDVFI